MDVPADIIKAVQPYTKSFPQRMASMYEALLSVDRDGIQGDVVECGVWRGGNIMMARIVSPERKCWLYDTFDGMTMPDPDLDVKPDGWRAIDRYHLKINGGTKWAAAPIEEVQESFKALGLEENCIWVRGPVEDTLLSGDLPRSIAVLRLDMDWHSPTKIALERLYPLLVPGGFLIIDDYGHWLGCKKAVDDYFGEIPRMIEVDYSCRMLQKC